MALSPGRCRPTGAALPLFAPVDLLASKAADQPISFAVAAVENRHRGSYPAAVITGMAPWWSRFPGVSGSYFVHGNSLGGTSLPALVPQCTMAHRRLPPGSGQIPPTFFKVAAQPLISSLA